MFVWWWLLVTETCSKLYIIIDYYYYYCCCCYYYYYYYYYYYWYYYWYSALGPVWAETRVQSGDWYGSGMLHPGQVLRGSLPLISPHFLDVPTFHHQVPPRPPRCERSQWRKWELWARMLSGNFAEMTTFMPFRDLLHAANPRHGTNGFTSPPKEGVLRNFSYSIYCCILPEWLF